MVADTENIKVPEIRFKDEDGNDFPDWEIGVLSDVAKKSKEKNKSLQSSEVLTNSATRGVVSQGSYFDREITTESNLDGYYIVPLGAFVYNPRISKLAPAGPINRNNLYGGLMSPLYTVFSVEGEYSDFLEIYFKTTVWHRYMKAVSNFGVRHDRMNVSTGDFFNMPIALPCTSEQRKIGEFLIAVGERIAKLKRKKVLLEEYKKGMIQKLFSQEIRFKDEDGNDFPDWENRRMGDFLSEHGEKSKGNEPVFSVSVHKGLVDQIEHLGRSFAAADTSHYNRVNPDDVVYTKSPTGDFPYGIVKRNQSGVAAIVSPLYGVFEPESKGLGVWLNEYFSSTANTHNYLNSIIQKGAKNTINITNRTFLSKALKVPSDFEEQSKIGQCFSEMNHRIDSLAEQINKAQEFKRGLLQKMFV